MGRKIIFGIVILFLVGSFVRSCAGSEGNVSVAVSNMSGLSVGDCIKNYSPYDEVACSSGSASYRVLAASYSSDGSDCPDAATATIEETSSSLRSGSSSTLWCVGSVY